MPSNYQRLGLSLSGGGYRASVFHLGTLKKLQEMGVLHKVAVISTISGGSITGACYFLQQQDFQTFYDSLYEKLRHKSVVQGVFFSLTFLQLIGFTLISLGPAFYFLFTPYAWLVPILFVVFIVLLWRFQCHIFPVSKRIEKIYDQFFYDKKTLDDLPEHPVLVIGSTNLPTARTFTFSKHWMQDSTYQYLDPPITFEAANFPLARAVMASSCVPFAFTPISIDKKCFTRPSDAIRIHPVLVDGGVYDNLGIDKIVQRGRYACDTVITRDAGSGSSGEGRFRNTFSLLLETVNVFMSRIKKVQMVQDVYDNAETANKQIAYFSLGWDVEKCIGGFIDNLEKKQITESVIAAHDLKGEWIASSRQYEDVIRQYLEQKTGYATMVKPTAGEKKIARGVVTNLVSLSELQMNCLIRQAALTELQVKLYCPSIFYP